MARYAIFDENMKVLNVIEWDGITLWTPPANTVVEDVPDFVSRNDVLKATKVMRPNVFEDKDTKPEEEVGELPKEKADKIKEKCDKLKEL